MVRGIQIQYFIISPNSGISFESLYSNPINGTSCVGDFNEDGLPDLIVMGPNYNDFTTSYVNLLLNTGNKTFARYNLGLGGLNNGSVGFTKIGTKKFLVSIQGGNASPAANNNAVGSVAVLQISGLSVTCTKLQNLDYGLIDGNLLFVDCDNDGYQDIVQFGGGRKVYTYINNANASFTLTTSITGLKGASKGQARLMDINKDGKQDIVSIDQSYGICVYLNSGNSSFTEIDVTSVDFGFKLKPRFEFGDFDEDGNIDMVVFDTNNTTMENSVVFFYGDGSGNFIQGAINNFMGGKCSCCWSCRL